MKILTLSNYYPEHSGGIEFVAMNLVKYWRIRHQVRWMASDVRDQPHKRSADDVPLPARNFTENHLGFPYPIPTLKSIPSIIKQVKWCDIVHIHDCLYFANIIAFLAARTLSKPIVVTQHVGVVPYKEQSKNILQRIAYNTIGRLILKNSEEIVFVNSQVKDRFEYTLNLNRTSLILNGVNGKIFYPSTPSERDTIRGSLGYSEKDILLLFIGRFTQKKGIHIIREIALNHPNYYWIVIGRGDAETYKLNMPNVKLLPPQKQENLRNFYTAADVFVLPSTGEGFPLAVQESLSCGLPTAVSEEIAQSLPDAPLISLNTSSLPEIFRTLDVFLCDEKEREAFRRNSEEYAKQWDWEISAQKYEDLFTKITHKYSNRK
jgi:glycosyltransferase involved in cell wall biosynthesis